MRNTAKYSLESRLPLAGAALLLSAATLLGGCVVREVSPPPPPRYVRPPPPPPPPAYEQQAPAQAYDSAPADGGDVEVQASDAPPPLPDYDQPPCPEEGYMWTPGYWAWGGGGYYWVPGTWVQPPSVGVLWTPAYWGFVGGVYRFHAGYWGPHVGYYGGINYGFGYVGVGFAGGRWVGNSFAYNRSVNNVNVTIIHNTYNETVVNNVRTKVSFNGGPGGTAARPSAQERAWAAERHAGATPMQRQHFQESARNPALNARTNGGHPAIAATPRPAAFNGAGVVGARGAMTPAGTAFRAPGQQGQQNGGARMPGGPQGQVGQQNGGGRSGGPQGQVGQQNGAARAPGAPGQPGQAAGQAGQPRNFVRTPGQPNGVARTQGQPAQGQPQSHGANQPGENEAAESYSAAFFYQETISAATIWRPTPQAIRRSLQKIRRQRS